MASTERIYRLTVDANQAVRELQKLNSSVAGIDNKFSALGAGIKSFGLALAAGFSFDQLVNGLKTAIDKMDDMGKSAQKLGVSVEQLQALSYAADLSGLSFETMSTAVGRLSQAMAGFSESGSKAADALKAMGVNVKTDTTQALAAIADQFQKMPDGVQKTALAMELFGKAGKDMIPFLNQGGEAVRRMAEESERLGATFTAVASEQAERFNDALTKIGYAAKGIFTQLATGLLPALTTLAERFVDNYEKGTLFSRLGSAIGTFLVELSARVIVAVGKLEALGRSLAAVARAAVALATGDFSGAWNELTQGMVEAKGFMDRANSSALDLIGSYNSLAGQTTAASRGVQNVNVALGNNARASRAASDENKRYADEVNKLMFELAGVNYAIRNEGKEWSDLQKFVQQGAYGVRAMFSKERERELESYLGKLGAARTMLDAMRAAEVQARKDDEKVLENQRRQADAVAERTRAYESMVDAIKRTVDPTIELSEAYENLEKAFANGDITLSQYTRKYQQLEEASRKALGAIEPEIKKVTSVTSILEDNFNSFFQNMERGTAGLQDAMRRMVESILIQLARLAASQLFDKFFGADTSWGLSNPFTPKTGSRERSSLGLYSVPQTVISTYAGAGPQQFVGSSGSSGVSVNVVNNAGAEIGVESRQNADGSTMIDILVERKVKGMIASGAMDRVMASTFGARRRGFA